MKTLSSDWMMYMYMYNLFMYMDDNQSNDFQYF